jgi:uncharacterized protein YndB with AHSA1/START domain
MKCQPGWSSTGSTGRKDWTLYRAIYINFKNKEKMQNEKNSTEGRELLLNRTLDAPIDLVWEVLTNPAHLAQWWGPDGFTTSISKMDVRVNGEWNLVMHGPDGTDYENRIIFKEIVHHKRLLFEYQTTPKHVTTVELQAMGEKTLLRWHMTFESKEQFIQLVKEFKADKGLEQNVEKWNRYLLGTSNKRSAAASN